MKFFTRHIQPGDGPQKHYGGQRYGPQVYVLDSVTQSSKTGNKDGKDEGSAYLWRGQTYVKYRAKRTLLGEGGLVEAFFILILVVVPYVKFHIQPCAPK